MGFFLKLNKCTVVGGWLCGEIRFAFTSKINPDENGN